MIDGTDYIHAILEQPIPPFEQFFTVLGLERDMIEGNPLAESLLAGNEFLPMLGRMAAVGEATGTLDDVLDETARFHEEQLRLAIRRFSIIIEPIIVVTVGAIVGFVYISFFLALFAAAGS